MAKVKHTRESIYTTPVEQLTGYQKRLLRGFEKGLSRSQARGHTREHKGEVKPSILKKSFTIPERKAEYSSSKFVKTANGKTFRYDRYKVEKREDIPQALLEIDSTKLARLIIGGELNKQSRKYDDERDTGNSYISGGFARPHLAEKVFTGFNKFETIDDIQIEVKTEI